MCGGDVDMMSVILYNYDRHFQNEFITGAKLTTAERGALCFS